MSRDEIEAIVEDGWFRLGLSLVQDDILQMGAVTPTIRAATKRALRAALMADSELGREAIAVAEPEAVPMMPARPMHRGDYGYAEFVALMERQREDARPSVTPASETPST